MACASCRKQLHLLNFYTHVAMHCVAVKLSECDLTQNCKVHQAFANTFDYSAEWLLPATQLACMVLLPIHHCNLALDSPMHETCLYLTICPIQKHSQRSTHQPSILSLGFTLRRKSEKVLWWTMSISTWTVVLQCCSR